MHATLGPPSPRVRLGASMRTRPNVPTAPRGFTTVALRAEPPSRLRSLADPESLREFIKNLGEGIYITSPDGRILDANQAFLETVGIKSLSDIGELSAYDLFVDPQQRELEMRLLERDGRVKNFEFQVRRTD